MFVKFEYRQKIKGAQPEKEDIFERHTLCKIGTNTNTNECRHVKFKDSLTKWPVQKQTHIAAQKHAEHQDATDIQNILFVVFFGFFFFLNIFMLTGHVSKDVCACSIL